MYLNDTEYGGVLDIGDATGVRYTFRELYALLIKAEYNYSILRKIPACRQRYRISLALAISTELLKTSLVPQSG